MGLLGGVFIAGKEREQRVPLVHKRQQDMRFADEQPLCDGTDAFERLQRVSQVIEHAE